MSLDPDLQFITLDADKAVTLGKKIRSRGTALVVLSGDFGGGTLTLGYRDDLGGFQTLGLSRTTEGSLEGPYGTGMELAVDLSGSTSPDLKIGFVVDALQPDPAL